MSLGPSPEYADWWYVFSWRGIVWAGFFTAVAAVATVAFTIVQFWADGIKDKKSEERQRTLEVQTEIARGDVAKAHVAIAIAQEKAASLEQETAKLNSKNIELLTNLEQEKIARLKLEEKVQPRNITPEQELILTTMLNGSPKGTVLIVPDWTNPEAKIFAKKIELILQKVGFTISDLNWPDKPLSFGKLGAFLVIKDKSQQPPHFIALYQAFTRAGFNLDLYEEKYVPDVESVLIGVSAK